MIDTHCHLLHSIDDGPSTLQDAEAIATALVAEGVTWAVATPHFSERFRPSLTLADDRATALTQRLDVVRVPLRLSVAAEFDANVALTAPCELLSSRTLGDAHVLVDCPTHAPASMYPVLLERLARWSLTPIFAHPERSKAFRRTPRLAQDLRRDGALIQVICGNLVRGRQSASATAAWTLLADGSVDLIATDCHSSSGPRAPAVLDAEALVTHRLGAPAWRALTEDTPGRILAPGASRRP